MLSAKRIIEIFRTRGAGKGFANPVEVLSAQQLSYTKEAAADEPLIARMSSARDWFVLTKTHFVAERLGKLTRVSFDDIYKVETAKPDLMNPRTKIEGGNLDLELRNGGKLRVNVQPGGPYFGLMNVLMRFAAINRRKKFRSSHGFSPTTDEQRPTTQP